METSTPCLALTTAASRREVLCTATLATTSLVGILAARTAPVYAATRTVTMRTDNHFVPASDENLRKLGKEFEKAHQCRVKIDFIAHRDTYVKIAKEQETRQGHAIVLMFFSKPHLHHEDLEESGTWAAGELQRVYKHKAKQSQDNKPTKKGSLWSRQSGQRLQD